MADIAGRISCISQLLQSKQQQKQDHLLQQVSDLTISSAGKEGARQAGEAFSSQGLATQYADFLVTQCTAERLWSERTSGSPGSAATQVAERMVSCLVNFSDDSLPICRELSRHARYFNEFFRPLLEKFQNKSDDRLLSVVTDMVDIVYNMYFKNDGEIFDQLEQYNLVPAVKPLLQSRSVELSTSSLLLIAFAVDERQAEIFQGAKTNISHLIGVLRKSLTSKNRTARGFHSVEVAKCINRLALNDGNKELLVQLDLLPVVQKLLDSPMEEELSQGLEILFTLSFNEANLAKIGAQFKQKLAALGADSKWKESKSLKSLLFRLGGRPASASQQQQQQQQQLSVMISYNHASSQLVRQLHTAMQQRGVRTWVDFEQMRHGSTLDAMADAVDGAAVVLLCVTRQYKESNNCRLEAEYAWRRGKQLVPVLLESKYRPTGWLGLLLGSQLYYDLSGAKYSFEDKFKELMLAVESHLGGQQQLPKLQQQQQQQQQQLAAVREHSYPVLPGITQLRSWDAARVAAWCSEQQLCSELCSMQLTGCELQFLASTLRRSPEYFGRVMEKFVRLEKLHDLAKFVLALEELANTR